MAISNTPAKTNSTTLSAQVSATFAAEVAKPGGTTTSPQFIMEVSQRPPIVPTVLPAVGNLGEYFRVHPESARLALVTTSGSVSLSSVGLSKHAEEVIAFSGTSQVMPLKYPKASGVTFNIVGNLIGAEIRSEIITITFDSTRNALVSSKLCYGNVHVAYSAPYDLWLAKFDSTMVPITPTGLKPSAGTGPDDDPIDTSKPMSVLAYWKVPTADQNPNEVLASLNLTPPTVAAKLPGDTVPTNVSAGFGTGTTMPKIKFEIDPNYTPRLIPNESTTGNLVAGVRVRVIPAAQPDMGMTSGQIVAWADGAGGQIEEMLTFSGGMSASLSYQPAGSVTLEPQGVFVDQWNRPFNPTIVGPGGDINKVNWTGPNTFDNPQKMQVPIDQVMIGDLFGDAINCYGILKATYSFTFKTFDFRFDFDPVANAFKTAFVVGSVESVQVANIRLDPPTLKGIK